MQTRNVFLDEQARQAFDSPSAPAIPELVEGVLEPALGLDRRLAAAALERAYPHFLGARARGLFSLRELVLWQLRPRREVAPSETDLVEILPEEATFDKLVFDGDVREAALDWLEREVDGETSLGQMLADARGAGLSEASLELLVLHALHDFAPDEEAQPIFSADLLGRPLRAEGFYGDDLLLARARGD